jgi:hypothetical protein
LLTLATTIHQSQVTTNISGLDIAALKKALGVVEATPEEIEEEKAETAPSPATFDKPEEKVESVEDSWEFRRQLRKVLQDDLMRRFAEKYKIPLLELRRDVKFESGLENHDPIMSRTLIYQGYVKTDQKEYFNQQWDDESLRIGQNVCEIFYPYFETDSIKKALERESN